MGIIITSDFDGVPLRNYLRGTLRFSSGIISELKQSENGLTVNGSRVTVRYILRFGDELIINFPENEKSDIEPVCLPLDIIYEDSDILAVNKPGNMPTHTSHGHYNDTLANAVAYYYREKNFVFRAVNRLDRVTSGIVLIAKNRLSAYLLSEQMKNGDIKKTYYALCHGIPPEKEGIIDRNIIRAEESIIFRRVCDSGEGQNAITIYKCLKIFKLKDDIISFTEFQPQTGRTHQLRVHSAYAGFPILCDGLYGDGFDGGFDRLCLHAGTLSFTHPATREPITLKASLPVEWEIIKRS